jgi:DNA-directed RNA polymerase specialized sigma subunit
MPRETIASLKEQLTRCEKINDGLMSEITRLQQEVKQAQENNNVVSKLEFDTLLNNYETLENKYKLLEKMFDKEKNKKSASKATKNARGAGRKRKDIEQQVQELRKNHTVKEIAEMLNVGTATVNRALNPNLRSVKINNDTK